jgi:uncharacterized membrane protein
LFRLVVTFTGANYSIEYRISAEEAQKFRTSILARELKAVQLTKNATKYTYKNRTAATVASCFYLNNLNFPAIKILGHPVHKLLLPLPAALFPMELVCYFLYLYLTDTSFGSPAFYALAGGVLTGWLTIIWGAVDAIRTPVGRPQVIKKTFLHGSINTLVPIVYTVMGYALQSIPQRASGKPNYPAP